MSTLQERLREAAEIDEKGEGLRKVDLESLLHEAADKIDELETHQIKPCQQTLHACIAYLIHGQADFSGLPEGLVEAFKARVEKLTSAYRQDAERYRWLRYGDNDERVIRHGTFGAYLPRNHCLDADIDAAIAAQRSKS